MNKGHEENANKKASSAVDLTKKAKWFVLKCVLKQKTLTNFQYT